MPDFFTELAEFAARQPAGGEHRIRRLLGVDWEPRPIDPKVERTWTRDGVDGREISWNVGYGPRTHGWLLRPASVSGPLPGVLALHGHDAFKYHGKEKIADGPDGPLPEVADLRRTMFGGRPFANELARRGCTVLCPDVLPWGSRRFPIQDLHSPSAPGPERLWIAPEEDRPERSDIAWYNRLAARHEHVLAKFCTILGVSLAGLVAFEDRVALRYLRSLHDLVSDQVGCVGLSGGGCRAALLTATSPDITATVIVGMMSTHRALLRGHFANHTWMFFPPNLPHHGDWPDLAAARAPSPLLVQYLLDDDLFPRDGMHAAHARLTELYEAAGAANNYIGQFYPGPHRFDAPMQDIAFAQIRHWLTETTPTEERLTGELPS